MRQAVVEAVVELRASVREEGAHHGTTGCLVTWEDGDELRAFLHSLDNVVPAKLPWVLLQTRPDRVTR